MNSTTEPLAAQDRPPEPPILGTIARFVSPEATSAKSLDQALKTLSQSRKIRFYLQSLARKLLPDERVAKCFRQIAPNKLAAGVDVMFSEATGRARYRNLLVCGRLWVCPVCAARITEQRRKELSAAVSRWPGKLLLVTYTFRHERRDRLSDLLARLVGKGKQRGAFQWLKSGKQWQEIRRDVEWVGSVRALEVTYGDNGWHVHIHELVFIGINVDLHWLNGLENRLKRRWLVALAEADLDATAERGVVVETANSRITEYIAKYGHDPIDAGWTVVHELVKSPSKLGRNGGRTAFQLLSDYGDGDSQAGALFGEYAYAFKNHRQLRWSPGMRNLLALGSEKSDEALAVAPIDETERIAGNLAPEQWRHILAMDLREQFLAELERSAGNWKAAWTWLAAQGVPEVVRVDATAMMWQEYERQRGPDHNGPALRNSPQKGGDIHAQENEGGPARKETRATQARPGEET